MAANSGPESGLASVTKAIDQVCTKASSAEGVLQGIGICAPGPLDPNSGSDSESSECSLLAKFPFSRRNLEEVQRPGKG